MESKCNVCNNDLNLSSAADGDKEAVYILHGSRDCVKYLKVRAESAETAQADTRTRLLNLRFAIEDEFRFRARVGQMNEELWLDRLCLKSLQEAIAQA